MVMYANEFKTKEKQKLTEIKNQLQHTHYVINVILSLTFFTFAQIDFAYVS